MTIGEVLEVMALGVAAAAVIMAFGVIYGLPVIAGALFYLAQCNSKRPLPKISFKIRLPQRGHKAE